MPCQIRYEAAVTFFPHNDDGGLRRLLSVAQAVAEDEDYKSLVVGNPDQQAVDALMVRPRSCQLQERFHHYWSMIGGFRLVDHR